MTFTGLTISKHEARQIQEIKKEIKIFFIIIIGVTYQTLIKTYKCQQLNVYAYKLHKRGA